jgi:hypothetical protein
MLSLESCDLSLSSPSAFVDDAEQCCEADRPQWFAIAVKPRYDKAVARSLETKGYETFVPLYKSNTDMESGARARSFHYFRATSFAPSRPREDCRS